MHSGLAERTRRSSRRRALTATLVAAGLLLVCGATLARTGGSITQPPFVDRLEPVRLLVADNPIATDAKVPADFALEMASGGGFSGVYQGHRITADGKVVKWRTGPNAQKRIEEVIGTLEPAALARLNETLSSAKFFEVNLDQPGNMTVTIAATRGGKQHTVRYPLPMDQHPESVRAVVEAIKAVTKPLEAGRAQPQ